MKYTIISTMLVLAIVLSGCSNAGFLQIKQGEKDPYAPLPTVLGESYVQCSVVTDCSAYLEQNGVFDVATECRAGTCYYMTEPVSVMNERGDSFE